MPTNPRRANLRPRQPVRTRRKRTYTAGLTAPRLPQRRRIAAHSVVGILLIVLAAALVPTHLAEHAGAIRLMPPAWEDLLIGFPTAGILIIAGFIALLWR